MVVVAAQMAAELRGDMSSEQEARMLAAVHEKEQANDALKEASKQRAERAAALEEAFLAIKQATGVATVEDMVEKFLNQGASASTPLCRVAFEFESGAVSRPCPCPSRVCRCACWTTVVRIVLHWLC
jgi:uncharacterized protein (DUF4415 family)